MRNNTGPRTEPLGTVDATLPQVECDPLTETAWTLLCRKSFIHVKVGEYQPLIFNTFVVKNVVPVKAQLCSHGRVASFL